MGDTQRLGAVVVLFFLVFASAALAQEPDGHLKPVGVPQNGGPQPDSPSVSNELSCPGSQSALQSEQPQPQSGFVMNDLDHANGREQQTAPTSKQCGEGSNQTTDQTTKQPSDQTAAQQPPPEPKRILGVMPNFRAVTAGELPPPPTPKENFKIATQNSFDYSAFIFVGITSLLAEGTDAHPDLGKGVAGFGRYYWRGFLDKTDGNYLVIFALPTVFHQDERYYAKEKGPILKRGIYAASRIFITPNYQGHASFNASELLGRAMAQGISVSYYPSADRTFGALASKYGYALGRDALTNVFREFWPDIAVHVLHRNP